MFSVPVTVILSKTIVVPVSPLGALASTYPFLISISAPIASSAFRCKSTGLCPIAHPPGKETRARPGQWVAISGIGGLGHIAVQYARAMGMRVVAVTNISMVSVGSVIGIVGTLVGGVLGVLAALNVSAAIKGLESLLGIQFLNAEVYFIDYLPSQVQGSDVALVCGAALVLSFLATLYPAWRAARTQPAEALRYE